MDVPTSGGRRVTIATASIIAVTSGPPKARNQLRPAKPQRARPATGEGDKRQRHGRRGRHKDFRRPQPAVPIEGAPPVAADGAPAREPREDRKDRPRERFEGKGRSGDQQQRQVP